MEDIVQFELAKKLKEKGYPQNTRYAYQMGGACYFKDGRFYSDGVCADTGDCYAAPQIHQVLKWLREEKGLHIEIRFDNRGFGACIDKYDIHTLEHISFNPLLDYGFHKSYE